MKKLLIDFHIHIPDFEVVYGLAANFPQNFPSEDSCQKFCEKYSKNPDALVSLMDKNGVDYSVVLAQEAPLTVGNMSNDNLATFCCGHPRLIPFCTLNPHIHSDMGKALMDLHVKYGFKGLKLYPTYYHFYPNDPVMYPLYSVAQELSLPVLFHTGSSFFKNARIKYGNPLYFDDIAVDFPDLKIIMAHGGIGPWYDEAATMVRIHPNVYIDISGLPPQKLLDYFPDLEKLSHKYIFGTDWPTVDVGKNIEKIRNMPISEIAIDRILGENACRVLGL